MKHSHERRCTLPFHWPEPPLHVVLVEPEIPPNTGTIARLCAATGSILHLVGPLGFRLTDRALKRAGLDYWDSVDVRRDADFSAFAAALPAPGRVFLFSTAAPRSYASADYRPGDALVFGSETHGLPDELLAAHAGRALAIPVRSEHVRSINLATAVAVVLYEALRQIDL